MHLNKIIDIINISDILSLLTFTNEHQRNNNLDNKISRLEDSKTNFFILNKTVLF